MPPQRPRVKWITSESHTTFVDLIVGDFFIVIGLPAHPPSIVYMRVADTASAYSVPGGRHAIIENDQQVQRVDVFMEVAIQNA